MLSLVIFIVLITCFGHNVFSKSTHDIPKVTLSHGGILVGSYMKTVNGKPIKAFRGIPYAEPPIGALRFKSPVPAKAWSGEKLVSDDGTPCPFLNLYERNFETIGNEDCLFLNVYVPGLRSDNTTLSVMVYIHGGGWMSGVGNSLLYGPQRLLDHDVILVSGNYRLGALGFMSTGTEDCPGNFGLKDQVLMLKWVQQNVESFGGNPNDVTIFGESAGGASVGYHIYSPISKGLFHKAILQSGTNFNEWAIGDKDVVVERAKKIGNLMKCPMSDKNFKTMIDCLRTKPANDIASLVRDFFVYDIDPMVVFPPAVEPTFGGSFLTENPRDTVEPPSRNIPVMIGITNDKGSMKSGPLLHLLKDDFIAKFHEVLPFILFYDHKPRDVQMNITKSIDEFYFKGKRDWSKNNHFNLTNLFSDNFIIWGQDQFLRYRFAAVTNTTIAPTYVYLYDHRPPKSLSEFFHAGTEYYGVCHTDELPYLFLYKVQDHKEGPYDQQMKWAMPYLWTNFAKTGNPTPEGSNISQWIASSQFPLNFAHIGRQTMDDWTLLSNEVGLFEDRVEFWRSLEKMYAYV